jgi:hypothetical protein
VTHEYWQSQTLYTWSTLPWYIGGKAEQYFIPAVYDSSDPGSFCRFKLVEVCLAAWILTHATVLDDTAALQSFPAASSTVDHGRC